jgi:1-aminocyclopropane-1-carboxylate deaminase
LAIIKYFETPVMELRNADFDAAGVRVLLKREDLNHPFVSGNKWWKLKPNLEYARAQKHNTVLTFGGAFSNHIYSTAAGAKESRLKSIGIIRGEETFPLNSTLTFAKSQEMQVHYISREAYRNKDDDDFIKSLREQFGSFYFNTRGRNQ